LVASGGKQGCPLRPSSSSAAYNNRNQNTALSYDAAGEVISDGLNSYLYDAEGRVCALKDSNSSLTSYVYDAAGI
jgi:uncharacterized protein RhaS with RHS repeats